MPICKLCGDEKPLVESHIIAKSLYELDGYKAPSLIISDKAFPRRSRTGVYDRIVCDACERLFGPWDQYGKDILLKAPFKTHESMVGNSKIAYRIFENVDYAKLKLFFMSLLWRAHASDDPFFKRVKLGPHESKLKASIRSSSPLHADDFAVHIARFDVDGKTGILEPHAQRFDGVNYYQFYIAEYICYIKVDRRKVPYPFDRFILCPRKPLIILLRDFLGSKEAGLMRKLWSQNKSFIEKQATIYK